MYSIISPHKGPTHCYASETSNNCVLCNLYNVHIFISFYLYSSHFPSLPYFCLPWHIYFISNIFIYLALGHVCFMKSLLYFDLGDLIFLTNRNSSHCVSYVVYPNLTSHYDYG